MKRIIWHQKQFKPALIVLATSLTLAAVSQAATIPNLGTASNYAVLGLQNTKINNSLVTITGNEGVSAGGTLTNMAPSKINGNVFESSAGQYSGPGTLTGSVNTNAALLAQNNTDALSAYSQAVALGLSPTQTFAGIGSATTITGNGGLNVIDINGNISNSLKLQGTSSDVFVVVVSGTLNLTGSVNLDVAGGVTASDVLYAFTSSGQTINTHVNEDVFGTLLAPNDSFTLDGTFNGEIIGGGSIITLMSGAIVNSMPFTPATPPSPVPEPSTLMLLGMALPAGLVLRKRLQKKS